MIDDLETNEMAKKEQEKVNIYKHSMSITNPKVICLTSIFFTSAKAKIKQMKKGKEKRTKMPSHQNYQVREPITHAY